jgi:plastocyanin
MAWIRRMLVAAAAAATLVVGGPAMAGGGMGGECYQAAPAGLGDGWVAVIDSCFTPNVLEVETGRVVRWKVDGGMPHTVSFTDSTIGSGQMTKGATYAVQFNAPGTYTYACLIHPGMDGRVDVAGDAVNGPTLLEITDGMSTNLADAPKLASVGDATTVASVDRPQQLLVSLDAGAGFTVVLFGLALGAGAAIAMRARRPDARPAPRDDVTEVTSR